MNFMLRYADAEAVNESSVTASPDEVKLVEMEAAVRVDSSVAVVSPQTSTSENNSIQSSATDDCQLACLGQSETENVRRPSDSASACADENVVTVCDGNSEFCVSGEKLGVDMEGKDENCADVSATGIVSVNHTESCSNRNTSELVDVVDLHSPVDIMYAGGADEDCTESGSGEECSVDVNSNVITDVSPRPADNSPVSRVTCDTCLSYVTGSVVIQDECSHVLFTSDVEYSEATDKPAGLNTWYAKHKTDGRFMKPTRHMSTLDRKSRPVPLPRSNTFRAKSASEVASSPSQSSIPVQYETCSSLKSKICQTRLEDKSESAYLEPLAVNFSEIYVDHRTVEEWPSQWSSKHAAEVECYESDYDVLREDVWTFSDDYKRMMNPEREVAPASGLQTYESDYDVLRDDIWGDASDTYDGLMDETDDVAGAGQEADVDNPGRWYNMSEIANSQPSSPPVDVSAEEFMTFVLALFHLLLGMLSINSGIKDQGTRILTYSSFCKF